MSLCNADQCQLVIVDIQEKLGAAMPGKVINRVVNNVSLLARASGVFGVPVLVTEQYPKGLGPTLPAITSALPPGSAQFEKTCFAATQLPAFSERLDAAGRRQVLLAGIEAHVCVLQTAVRLHEAGKQVMVIEDAVCSRKLENYQNALDRIRQYGIMVISTESIVFEWLQDKNHPHFKTLAGLVR